MAKSRNSRSRSRSRKSKSKSLNTFFESNMKKDIVTYIAMFLAAVTLIGHIMTGDVQSVILFVMIGVVMYFFTKNVGLILGASVLFTHLFKLTSCQEGLENEEEEEEEAGGGAFKNQKKKESMDTKEDPEECTGDNCRMEGMNKIKPMALDGNDENVNVDSSKTIEGGYASIDNILGKKGVDRLSADTERLMARQDQLMKTVDNLGPMMKQMNSIIGGIGEDGGGDKLLGIASKMFGGMGGDSANK